MTIVGESEKRSQRTLCRLLGYTRQAYNRRQRVEERGAIRSEFVIREVVKIREVQKRVGTRKLYHMIDPFLAEHGIKMGRDRLNELLKDNSLLVRKRRLRTPRTTFSAPWRRYPNLIRDYVPTAPDQVLEQIADVVA